MNDIIIGGDGVEAAVQSRKDARIILVKAGAATFDLAQAFACRSLVTCNDTSLHNIDSPFAIRRHARKRSPRINHPLGHESALRIEHLHAPSNIFRSVDVALAIDGDAARILE